MSNHDHANCDPCDHEPDPAPWLHPIAVVWGDDSRHNWDEEPLGCTPDMPERGSFCAAAYLVALESGFEFWPEQDTPSLCPWHWQQLLDRSAQYDGRRTLQNANAYAVALYDATRRQMRRAARASMHDEAAGF